MQLPEAQVLWIILIGTAIVLTFVGFFIITVITNQRRFIGVQREKIEENARAETLLRSIPGKIIQGQEEERKRVARDLHDGINQMLASIKYRLHTAKSRASDDAGLGGYIDGVLRDLDRTMDEVKHISHNLHPKVLDELGFNAAIRALCDQFTERTKVPVRQALEASSDASLTKEIELGIFRIIQEALNNIEKHSGATAVRIETRSLADSSLEIAVIDNGRGFSPNGGGIKDALAKAAGGLGMSTMRERAALLAGEVTIQPAGENTGAKILLRIPVPARQA